MNSDIRQKMAEYRKRRLEELENKTDFEFEDLTAEHEAQIVKSILAMPADKQNLLIFKHCYNHSFDSIEDLLDIENARGEYLNLVMLLSESIDMENKLISDYSMDRVCERALNIIAEEHQQLSKKDKKNGSFAHSLGRAKKIAAGFLVFICITSVVLLGANSFANGKVFEWIVNRFDKYISFKIGEENAVNKNNYNIEITYIPEGFELDHNNGTDYLDFYYYRKDKGYLAIEVVYNKITSLLNTEDDEIEFFYLDDVEVIVWGKAGINFFVCSKNGVGLKILGNISKDDFIEIYNGIIIEEKH